MSMYKCIFCWIHKKTPPYYGLYKLGLCEAGFLLACQTLVLGFEFKKGSHNKTFISQS